MGVAWNEDNIPSYIMENALFAGTAMFLVLLAIAAVVTRQQKREWERQLHHDK